LMGSVASKVHAEVPTLVCSVPLAPRAHKASVKTRCNIHAADDAELIKMLLLQEQMETMYAVIPLPGCPHMDSVCQVPARGIDAHQPCGDCADSGENWLCLTCYQVYCGRYRKCHMVEHGNTSGHKMVLSLADLSVWCYRCQAYVHHERLIPAKRAAHRSKFGEDMPC